MTTMLVAFVLVLIVVALLVGRDVTSRREIATLRAELAKANARVIERNSLATVGEMVSTLAQELKTPLQDVLGSAELMLATSRHPGASGQSPGKNDRTGEIDEIQEIQQIRDGVERAAGIVRNLVAFTETVSLSCRWHDVNDILDRAVDACQHELREHGIVVDRPPGARLPMVYVDGRQLEKVLTAMLTRPAQAVEASGVPVRPDHPFTVAIAASLTSAPDERVVLTIADDGPAGEQAAVAAALATGRRVIEAHGGTLTMASRASSFGRTKTIIELPIAAVAAAKAQETSPTWTESSTSSTSIASGISTS